VAGLTFPHPLRITADPAWGWAGGVRHPPEADYPADMFTAPQLREMAGDAALTLSVLGDDGQVLGMVPNPNDIPGEEQAEGETSGAPVAPASTQPAEGKAMATALEGEGEQPGQDKGQPATDAAPARAAAKKKTG